MSNYSNNPAHQGGVMSSQPNRGRTQPFLVLFAALPLLILFSLIYWYQPNGVALSLAWVDSLGINFSLRLDGLSFLFACLISGIGTLIQIYALSYMKGKAARFSFHLYLTLFMLAMLGVVMSDNVLLLFVFWELTTITSYLLIGFNHEHETSRKNALQSLVVTGAGGLALLAGLILLGIMAGSYELSVIVSQSAYIAGHALFVPSLLLILLGAFTKSAQFPFHFWLPNAMAAPTPVSAYLHSATMVKAGIYLLARLSPVYADHDIWFYSLGILGAFTALWCGYLALKQSDLKLMLAHSTNVALGKLTLLLALGTEVAITAAVLFILAHSFYKAALFMVVGNIDKATGTRDVQVLRGLKSILWLSFIAATIAALSKSGVPPLMGFLSKEYMYKAGLEANALATMALFVVNVSMVALALALIIKPFLGPLTREVEVKSVESDWGLWGPAMLLAIGSVAVPVLGLNLLNEQLLIPAIVAVAPESTPQVAKLWQGFNVPLMLSGFTLLAGYVVYRLMPSLKVRLAGKSALFPDANRVFDSLMNAMMWTAKLNTRVLQGKSLSTYVLMFFVVLALLLLSQATWVPSSMLAGLSDVYFYEVAIALLLVSAAIVAVFARSRLLAVASLGMVGFMTTLVFMLYSAPDVAKTLLLVETLMVIFVVLFLRRLPLFSAVPSHKTGRKLLHAAVAGAIGFTITVILIHITSQPLDTTLADFFGENSVPGGHGRNIVNVILVDFRAFDTLGEVVVVVMAGLAAVSLLSHRKTRQKKMSTLIFNTTSHIVSALMLVFSFYLLLRGHNSPGGGFIGALIAVIGLSLLMFAESTQYVRGRMQYAPFGIAFFGILLSFAAGMSSWLFDLPFLTGLWWKDILPLGTPLVFDVGIYLAIIGGVMAMLLHVKEGLD